MQFLCTSSRQDDETFPVIPIEKRQEKAEVDRSQGEEKFVLSGCAVLVHELELGGLVRYDGQPGAESAVPSTGGRGDRGRSNSSVACHAGPSSWFHCALAGAAKDANFSVQSASLC